MKKCNFKSVFAAMLAGTLFSGFQAKAQTDITDIGSIQITSITDVNSTIYDASTLITSAGQVVNFNFTGTIDTMSTLSAGEQITIPISIASGAFFPNLNLSFAPTVTYNGQTIFNVSYDNSSNTITLTATAAAASAVNGALSFTLQGITVLSPSPSNSSATTTVYTVGGNSYTLGNQSNSLQNSLNTLIPVPLQVASSSYDSSVFYFGYSDYEDYDYLLNGSLASMISSNPYYTGGDIIIAAVITPPPLGGTIASISLAQPQPDLMVNYAMSDGSNTISTTNIEAIPSPAFTEGSIPAGLITSAGGVTQLLAQAQTLSTTTLKPGYYAIVNNGDGSWTVAINFGPLIGSPYNEYPAETDVTAADNGLSQAMVEQAIQNQLSAVEALQYITVTFADPTVNNMSSTRVFLATVPINGVNGSSFQSGSASESIPNLAVANTTGGGIKVNYVDVSGNLITDTTNVGYSPNTLTLTPPDTIKVALSPRDTVTYTLVARPTAVDSAATALGTSTDNVLTATTTEAYPATGSETDLYYVYEPITAPLPITGLQLTAQPKGNTVQLTWGTLTEINSKTFTVQRSADGGKTWVTVNTQPTKAMNGNSSVPLSYTAQDIVLQSGSYEYRVVETDINGTTTTSNVATVNITTNGSAVYPNPTKSLLNVVLPAGASSATYRMISSDGKIVLSGTMTNAGNHGTIEVAGIASGIYFLQVTVNNTTQTYEVQIQQ